MRLSEAMMLASTTGDVVRENDWECCALGISARVAGVPEQTSFKIFGIEILLNEKPMAIEKEWPWLGSYENGGAIEDISDRFEWEGMSVSELADYVRSIEPDCDCNRFNCDCAKANQAVEVMESQCSLQS